VQILPLAPEPFMCPSDRDMLPSERRQFVRTHRTCVFGTPRRADGPAMSIVYYVPTDTDELLVSTMRERGKAKLVARSPNGGADAEFDKGAGELDQSARRPPLSGVQVAQLVVVVTEPPPLPQSLLTKKSRLPSTTSKYLSTEGRLSLVRIQFGGGKFWILTPAFSRAMASIMP
jgi:hypothetical protein